MPSMPVSCADQEYIDKPESYLLVVLIPGPRGNAVKRQSSVSRKVHMPYTQHLTTRVPTPGPVMQFLRPSPQIEGSRTSKVPGILACIGLKPQIEGLPAIILATFEVQLRGPYGIPTTKTLVSSCSPKQTLPRNRPARRRRQFPGRSCPSDGFWGLYQYL